MEELLNKLFDEKTIKLLSYIQGKKTIHVRETSREINLPVSTVFRLFKKLGSAGLLKTTKVGSFKIYSVNTASPLYSITEKIVPKMKPIDFFIKEIMGPKVEQILLLDEGEDRASIMVIGDVKAAKAQELTEQIKAEFLFSIKALVFSKGQYENLESLNMKPTPKKVLYKRE